MLEHRYRFHGHGSLNFLYRHGKTARGRSLSVRAVVNPRRVHARCAVVVSKKVFKAAPKRNRVRRRVYEILRTNWEHVSPEHDIVITVLDPHTFTMPYAELSEQLIGVMRQAGVWMDSAKKATPDAD